MKIDPICARIGQPDDPISVSSLLGGSFRPIRCPADELDTWLQIDGDELPSETRSFRRGRIYQFFVHPDIVYSRASTEHNDRYLVLEASKTDFTPSRSTDIPDGLPLLWDADLHPENPVAIGVEVNNSDFTWQYWDLYIADSDVFRCPDTGFSYFHWDEDSRKWEIDFHYA